MWRDFYYLTKKELLLLYRLRHQSINGLLFFVMIAALFPLTLDSEIKRLPLIAPGVIWMSALLATLLSMPQLFRDDFNDGSLSQLLLSHLPLSLIVFAKVIVHWLVFSLPLLLLAPLLILLFHLNITLLPVLLITLLTGSLTLHLLGAFAAALSVGLRQATLLLALVLMPLFVPVLIFACHALLAAQAHEPIAIPMLLLSALLVFALSVMPLLTAAALRISINY